MSPTNSHYTPQTVCACVFQQNNNPFTHPLILSVYVAPGCSQPALNFQPGTVTHHVLTQDMMGQDTTVYTRGVSAPV